MSVVCSQPQSESEVKVEVWIVTLDSWVSQSGLVEITHNALPALMISPCRSKTEEQTAGCIASYLQHKHESGIDLLIQLLARKRINRSDYIQALLSQREICFHGQFNIETHRHKNSRNIVHSRILLELFL